MEVVEEVVHLFRGGVEGGHPADRAGGLVPVVEQVALAECLGDGDREGGEDGVALNGVGEGDAGNVGQSIRQAGGHAVGVGRVLAPEVVREEC